MLTIIVVASDSDRGPICYQYLSSISSQYPFLLSISLAASASSLSMSLGSSFSILGILGILGILSIHIIHIIHQFSTYLNTDTSSGKVSWWGCGQHVPKVMDGVPIDEWCGCEPAWERDGKRYPPMSEGASWIPSWLTWIKKSMQG